VKKIQIIACLILLLASAGAFAQGGKMLALKDRGIIVKSFTKGDYINFEFSNHQWITGFINEIKDDSIHIHQFALQTIMTGYGLVGQDTLQLGNFTFHKSEILAFAHERGHYNSVFSNGAFLMTAGAGYSLLNIANSLIKNDIVFSAGNITKIGTGMVVWFLGKLQHNAHPNYRPIGKRFSVEII
jgi:hypothetical protein